MGGYDFLCHKVGGFARRRASSPAPGAALPEPSLPQAFFCGRSEYFRALLDDHFQESEQLEASGGLPAVTLHSVSPEVFTHVLYYVYSDHTEVRHTSDQRGERVPVWTAPPARVCWGPQDAFSYPEGSRRVCGPCHRDPKKQQLRRRASLSLLCGDVQGRDSTQLGGLSGAEHPP